MEEGLKGLLMGAALAAFILAAELAQSAAAAGNDIAKQVEIRNRNQRPVVTWQANEKVGG